MQIAFDSPEVIEFTLRKIHGLEHSQGKTKDEFFAWLVNSGLTITECKGKTIQQIVCDYYGVSIVEAFADDRPRSHAECRQVCAYFYLKMFHHKTGHLRKYLTSRDLKPLFNIAHNNIDKAAQTVSDRMEVEPRFREKLETIEKSIIKFNNDNLLNYDNS
jgi:chromosomal replication initiation ATPase DnaA